MSGAIDGVYCIPLKTQTTWKPRWELFKLCCDAKTLVLISWLSLRTSDIILRYIAHTDRSARWPRIKVWRESLWKRWASLWTS